MPPGPLEFLTAELAEIEANGLLRRLRSLEGPQGPHVRLGGRRTLNFSSNNYLGLAGDPSLIEAARRSLAADGVGAGASRLIAGTLAPHAALEQALATFHVEHGAVAFNSGYQANLGTIQALAGPADAIISDRLNHASLIDGCRLSRAKVVIYDHADAASAEAALAATRNARRRFLVTDTIFSMDGDRAPLAELRAVADRNGAILVIDEAHATGVLGPAGRGLAAAAGVRADVHLGTLSKAVGAAGGYVVGSRPLATYILNRARSFVFTTALPPSIAAAATTALELIAGPEGARRRELLAGHVARFAAGLASLGLLAPGAGTTPIFPVLVGDERRALRAAERLLDRGVFAQAIRPPTVPPGTARLRFALMATHEPADLDHALDALGDLVRDGSLPRSDDART